MCNQYLQRLMKDGWPRRKHFCERLAIGIKVSSLVPSKCRLHCGRAVERLAKGKIAIHAVTLSTQKLLLDLSTHRTTKNFRQGHSSWRFRWICEDWF